MDAINEMNRVATEVRLFPLLTLAGTPYPHLETIYTGIRDSGHSYTLEKVPYEFQRGGNTMLRII